MTNRGQKKSLTHFSIQTLNFLNYARQKLCGHDLLVFVTRLSFGNVCSSLLHFSGVRRRATVAIWFIAGISPLLIFRDKAKFSLPALGS